MSLLCSLCDRPYSGLGNSAHPFDGRCCDDCDDIYVVPTRIMQSTTEMHIPTLAKFIALGKQQRQMRAMLAALRKEAPV